MHWLLDPPIDITDQTTSGVPVWAIIVVAIVGAVAGVIGTVVTARVTRRNDKATVEQQMIDQLQEQVHTLTARVERLDSEVRTMRIRDIAWITYTSDLTRVALEAGGTPPQMPTELRVAPQAAPAV